MTSGNLVLVTDARLDKRTVSAPDVHQAAKASAMCGQFIAEMSVDVELLKR